MKKLYLLLICIGILQSYRLQAVELSVDLAQYESVGAALYYLGIESADVTEITITGGMIKNSDISAIRSLVNLQKLDMGGATVEGNAILNSAFMPLQKLTTVVLPQGLTSLGNWAFQNTGITSITIPSTVTTIGIAVFANCTALKSVTISEGVTNIGNNVFQNCTALVTVSIPASLTTIGNNQFPGCTSLTTINVAAGNTAYSSVDGVLFDASKTKLIAYPAAKPGTSYTVPASVIDIDPSAFIGCLYLTDLVVAGSSTYQSEGGVLFNADKTQLISYPSAKTATNYTIPNGVKTIGVVAFRGCSKLTTVNLPTSLTGIGESAFAECSGLTSIHIPASITSIGNNAFGRCAGLTSVIVPATVTNWGTYIFNGCTGLASATITNGITTIPEAIFSQCTSLTSVTIPTSVTEIGPGVFNGCTSLATVTLPNSLKSIGASAFAGCASMASITIPASVTSIGNSAFTNSGLTSITVPAAVTDFGLSAFNNCKNLSAAIISDGVTSIPNSTFGNCSNLTSVIIPASVTSIGDYAFQLSGLTSITLPATLISIGYASFGTCRNLTSVSIPASVTSIGTFAFSGCTSLTSIYAYRTQPVDLTSSNGVFGGVTNCTLYVPTASVAAYRAAVQWKDLMAVDGIVTATGISLNKPATSLKTGESETLVATVAPAGADKTVTWTTSSSAIATVDAAGKVTGITAGTATITAASQTGGHKANCTVTVTANKAVTEVRLNKASATIPLGSTEQLTAELIPADAVNKTITWTTANADVVAVDASGKLTAKALGTAVVTATSADGPKATCNVTVISAVTGVSLNKTEITLAVGSNQQLTATVTPATAPIKTVTWVSNEQDIATVDATGIVTGVSPGTAIITATTTDGNKRATCMVTVTDESTGIKIADAPLARLYPNPTDGIFTLAFDTPGAYRVTITDMTGKVLLRQSVSDQVIRMDISSYHAGVYLLVIDDSKRQSTTKIVKR